MNIRFIGLAALAGGWLLTSPAGAAPRLNIGPLTRTLDLPSLRACFVARVPGTTDPGLRFVTTGSVVSFLDPDSHPWPLLFRTNLFGVASDPERGVLLCTSRGVYTTHDGRSLRRLSPLVFTKIIAAPVGGLFARADTGLFGFDGQQFQLIRSVPWHSIDSVAVSPGGTIWFVGTYFRPDGSLSPRRLYEARDQQGQTVIDDPLPAAESASAVTEYFGRIVATIDGELRGTADDGQTWVTYDVFGRTDLTLTTLSLYDDSAWQALWIGVRVPEGGPAPLWFDDYHSGLVAQPVNAARVSQVTADLSRGTMLFVADEALFEAPYQVLDDPAAPLN
jgi:hypothetical protein